MKASPVSTKTVNTHLCITIYDNEPFLLSRWRGNNSVKGFYVNESQRHYIE